MRRRKARTTAELLIYLPLTTSLTLVRNLRLSHESILANHFTESFAYAEDWNECAV